MISRREAELLARRAALRERIAHERARLADAVQPIAAALSRVDALRAVILSVSGKTAAWVRNHPLWLAAAGAGLIALKPRRVLRWGARAWMLLRLYMRLRRVAERVLSAVRA